MAYKSLIRFTLQYANIILYPHTCEGRKNIEQVQKLLARIIFNKYDNRISASGVLELADLHPYR